MRIDEFHLNGRWKKSLKQHFQSSEAVSDNSRAFFLVSHLDLNMVICAFACTHRWSIYSGNVFVRWIAICLEFPSCGYWNKRSDSHETKKKAKRKLKRKNTCSVDCRFWKGCFLHPIYLYIEHSMSFVKPQHHHHQQQHHSSYHIPSNVLRLAIFADLTPISFTRLRKSFKRDGFTHTHTYQTPSKQNCEMEFENKLNRKSEWKTFVFHL